MPNKKDQIFQLIEKESARQQDEINLIASENYTSKDVLDAMGSCLMNKYVEGSIGQRYYSGCEFIDQIEQTAIDRFKKLFNSEHVNIQSHSGSQANMAVYFALLQSGDTVLSMNLSHGGHLTHGASINQSGKLYNFVWYGVDKKTELIDYDVIEKLAIEHKPKLIIAGASAYSRSIDFKRFSDIAKKVGAYLLADMAHIAGLVAAGLHQSPIPYADIVTMTTHKTFRGPRGGAILCKKEYAKKIDRAVMPGIQGGTFMQVVAAKAIACKEAMTDSFVEYQKQVVENTQIMVKEFKKLGYKIISDGTDNHLFLVDLTSKKMTGKDAEKKLEKAGVYVNRNMIPFDKMPPLQASGIRIGTAAMTTRGMKRSNAIIIVHLIDKVLSGDDNVENISQYKQQVKEILSDF